MDPTNFDLEEACAIRARTPATLDTWLRDLPAEWTSCDEGADTFSAFDVVGHLIHAERTDWIPRLERILQDGERRTFDPFDRFAQVNASRGKSLEQLLDELARLRVSSLQRLRSLEIDDAKLDLRGSHPELGAVTVRQLLATWVVHDLGHVAQVARVMAKRYASDVGPWREYLPVLTRR
jgi:uncharacterized damage-inducible protein DinB